MKSDTNERARFRKGHMTRDPEEKAELQGRLRKIEKRLCSGKPTFDLLLIKGMAELMLGLSEDAIESLKSALLIKEGDFEAWCLLGDGFLDSGLIDNARIAYEKALSLCSENLDLVKNLPFIENIFENLQLIGGLESREKSNTFDGQK